MIESPVLSLAAVSKSLSLDAKALGRSFRAGRPIRCFYQSVFLGYLPFRSRVVIPIIIFCFALALGTIKTACAAEQEPATATPAIGISAEGKAREAQFSHNLLLNTHPGVPSKLIFRFSGVKPKSVRAIMLLDGNLLVVPLSYIDKQGNFRGSFPTPRESLSYQFQASLEGTTLLSGMFTAEARCAEAALGKIISAANAFPGQTGLLRQALTLEDELEQYKYIVSSLRVLLGEK